MSSKLTKLKAVNLMLRRIQQQPINSLESAGTDGELAETVLEDSNAEIQGRGWEFNTESGFELSPDINGNITPPANAIRIDAEDESKKIVIRDGKLYDKTDHTNVFSDVLKVNIVWCFDFEDLPEYVKWFVSASAALEFQQDVIGDQTLNAYLTRKMQQSYAEMIASDLEDGDYNILDNPETAFMLTNRIY